MINYGDWGWVELLQVDSNDMAQKIVDSLYRKFSVEADILNNAITYSIVIRRENKDDSQLKLLADFALKISFGVKS